MEIFSVNKEGVCISVHTTEDEALAKLYEPEMSIRRHTAETLDDWARVFHDTRTTSHGEAVESKLKDVSVSTIVSGTHPKDWGKALFGAIGIVAKDVYTA